VVGGAGGPAIARLTRPGLATLSITATIGRRLSAYRASGAASIFHRGLPRCGQPIVPYSTLQRSSAQHCPFGSSITRFIYCYLYLVTIPLVGFWVMGCVLKRSLCLISLGVLFACGGCASPGPATPSFAAMPGRGKSYEAFQRDDQYCQSSAQQAIGYQSPGEAANQTTVGTAAVGTALGAVAGAAIGSVSGNMGAGAALGAGTGLVAGSAIGAGNGDVAGGSLQARYDTVYAQCMTAKGNRIGGPPVAEPVYVYPPPYYWGPRYYFSYGW
jgi:Glycine-zipper domain